jgi:hypothetical protein
MRILPVSRVIPVVILTLFGCATSPEAAPAAGPAVVADEVAPVVVETEVIETEEASAAALSYYTDTQASRGDRFFRETCLSCHTSSEFRGRSFQRTWRGRSVGDLYDEIVYTMPDDNPGGLPTQTYLDVIAYVLRMNRFPEGDTELEADYDVLLELPLFPRTP